MFVSYPKHRVIQLCSFGEKHAMWVFTSALKFGLGNETTISNLSVQQSNYIPLGTVDDPIIIHSTLWMIVLRVAQKSMK